MLAAMLRELRERKNYTQNEEIKSIYFGGGTPSLLETEEINILLAEIKSLHNVNINSEITLEANPDDLDIEKLTALKTAGINRLSIGVQSFHPLDLQYLNRAHSSEKALQCITDAKSVGFELLTIDLIYGIPNQTDEKWLENLHILASLKIPHFSAYALTVEPQTVLEKWIKLKKSPPVGEEITAEHFKMLTKWAKESGYLHYEISNFCRENYFAKHNTAYWQGEKYLGIGPSAHSFNGTSRNWNIANNALYIKKIENNEPAFETEILSESDQYNEYVMTSLRTMWGCDLDKIKSTFGEKFLTYILQNAKPFLQQQLLTQNGNKLFLTEDGKLLSDKIIADLFHI